MIIKNIKKYFLCVLLLKAAVLTAASYYYEEDFSTAGLNNNTEWGMLEYGRDGIFQTPDAPIVSTQEFESGELKLYGSLYANGGNAGGNIYGYEGMWVSRAVSNGFRYNANSIRPFGVEAKRTYSDIDPDTTGGEPNDVRKRSAIGFWLFVNDVDLSTEFTRFSKYVQLSEDVGDYGRANNTMLQRHGVFDGTMSPLDFSNAIRPDGRTVDLSSIGNWDYSPYATSSTPNGNDMTFRIVHNGNKIEFLVNPDPNDNNAFPAEFCKIGEKSVFWSNNIQFMFNHEQKCDDFWPTGTPHQQDVNWDDVLVKSASDTSRLYFTNKVNVSNGHQWVHMKVSNVIDSTNAGINFIRVIKPSGDFEWTPNLLEGVKVSTAYSGSYQELNSNFYEDDTFPAADEFDILTNTWTNASGSNEIRILLGSQITDAVAANEHIYISLKLKITNANFVDKEFKLYVNAEQFDAMGTKGNYSTAGWQKTTGENKLPIKYFAPKAFASINPIGVNQGNSSYTFTYYLEAEDNSLRADIKEAAILIPYAFTNCTVTIEKTVKMGQNPTTRYSIETVPGLNFGGANKVIRLDYSGIELPPGGLDVITIKAQSSPETNSHLNKEYWEWKAWTASNSIDSDNFAVTTNANHPSVRVGVEEQTFSQPYDYQVIRAANCAPTSMRLSNVIEMAYFDVIRNGEGFEQLTNLILKMDGITADAQGHIRLYRTDGAMYDSFSTNELIASVETGETNMSFTDDSQTTLNELVDGNSPTRYWMALEVTNKVFGVYSNKVFIEPLRLAGNGPDGGVVTNIHYLSNMVDQKFTRIDTHKLVVWAETVLNSTVKQGSFNNHYLTLYISNADPDTTNHFSSIVVTNLGNSDSSDLGYLKLFRELSGEGFDPSQDKVIMAQSIGSDSRFKLNVYPPVKLTGRQIETFYAAFDVELGANIDDTIELRIDNATNIIFADVYEENNLFADPAPDIFPSNAQSFPLPGSTFQSYVVPSSSKSYDFRLQTVSYNISPDSFTTNLLTPIGFIDILMDTEEPDLQEFSSIQGKISSSSYCADINGEILLYQEEGSESGFQSNDTFVTNAFITDGASFEINNLLISNISTDVLNPERYYLVFKLTNDIEAAKTNKVKFQITNLSCQGPNGGVFDNTVLLDSAESKEIRADSYKVNVVSIETNVYPEKIKQGSANNKFLKIVLSGDDLDATNHLTHVDISTNGLANTVDFSAAEISSLKLLDDLDSVLGSASIGTSGKTRINLLSPYVISGTNENVFYVTFDVSSADSVQRKFFGICITNNRSFGFGDYIDDNFTQNSFPAPGAGGPSVHTNVEIIASASQPYDFRLHSVGYSTLPQAFSSNMLVTAGLFTLSMDVEKMEQQIITNVNVKLNGTLIGFNAAAYIYAEDETSSGFQKDEDTLLGSNAVLDTADLNIPVTISNISSDSLSPDSFYLVFKLTNNINSAKDSKFSCQIAGFSCVGPNGGVFENTNQLASTISKTVRVDSYEVVIESIENFREPAETRQGSANNKYMKIVIRGNDEDATNFLTRVDLSTNGADIDVDLSAGHIPSVKIIDSDGTILGSTAMDADGAVSVNLLSPYTLAGSNTNVLYAAFDVSPVEAVQRKTFGMIITNALSFGFDDYINDGFTQIGRVTTPVRGPVDQQFVDIVPSSSQPYDFRLHGVKYSSMPQSFTTNQYVPVGYFTLSMDVEQQEIQFMTNMDVRLLSSTYDGDISGYAYLYLEDGTSEGFQLTEDDAVTNVKVTGGADFSMPMKMSNISMDALNPDTFYLVFRLTNNIEAAKTNKVQFQITNMGCEGPNGGVFDNLGILTSASSAETRVDSYKVVVDAIENVQIPAETKQGSANNKLLKIIIRGDDFDATNFLTAIDLSTNSAQITADLANGEIPAVKILNKDNTVLGSAPIGASGKVRINFLSPYTLGGTNTNVLYAAFDVSADESVCRKKFGLMITNNAAFTFGDYINDGFEQNSFLGAGGQGPAVHDYVDIISSASQPYDFRLQSISYSQVPKGFSTNQIFEAAAINLSMDVEKTNEQGISAVEVKTLSSVYKGDISGVAYFYKETNGSDNLQPDTDELIAHLNISGGNDFSIPMTLSNLSTDALEPDTFYLAFMLTNDIEAAKTNKISFYVTNVVCHGPEGGVLANSFIFTNATAVETKADSYAVVVDNISVIGLDEKVKQGSANNEHLKIVLRCDDTDATNYLTHLDISGYEALTTAAFNSGSLSKLKVFDQEGNLLGSASSETSGHTQVNFLAPYELGGTDTNNIFISFDVGNSDDAIRKTISLRITNNTSFGFSDYIDDSLSQIGYVKDGGNGPAVPQAVDIISADSTSYDFSLSGISYSSYPKNFTTNEYVPVAMINVIMDVEKTNEQFFTNLSASISGSKYYGDISGEAYLFMETNRSSGFQISDKQIAVTSVTSSSFSLAFNVSNVSTDILSSDTFYLVFKLTNDIEAAKTNAVSFSVDSLGCSGPDGGVFSGISSLSSKESSVANIDSRKVVVKYISNAIDPVEPRQSTSKNKFLKIVMRGDDEDATNYLSSISVESNSLCSVNFFTGHIPSVQVIDSGGEIIGEASFSYGNTNIEIVPPLAIEGSNDVHLYIAYSVISGGNVIGKTFGLKVPNDAFGFSDGYEDGFDQISFAEGTLTGPPAGTQTNVVIKSFSWVPWDISITDSRNTAPKTITLSNRYAMTYVDLICDGTAPAIDKHYLTNLCVAIEGVAADIKGEIAVYRESSNFSTFNENDDTAIASINFSEHDDSHVIYFRENNLSTVTSAPSRFWVTLKLTNSDYAVFSNKVQLKITNLFGECPDDKYGGVFTNMELLSNNYDTAYAKVDDYQIIPELEYIIAEEEPRQSSFNNRFFSLKLISADADATNFFEKLTISNAGSANHIDFGNLIVYQDDGDGSFNSSDDEAIMFGSMNSNKLFKLRTYPPISLSGLTNEFFVCYDIELNAQRSNSISLVIPDKSSSFTFTDLHSSVYGNYDQTAFIDGSGSFPQTLSVTNYIRSYLEQPYDFYLITAMYNNYPESFTTNAYIEAGFVDMFRDIDNRALYFKGMDVSVLSDGVKNDVSGKAYLYLETNENEGFQLDDRLIGSSDVVGGADFSINCNVSNITLNRYSPDRVYLIFKLTNDIEQAKDNRVGFKIDELYCTNYNGSGLFTNTDILNSAESGIAQIDSYRLQITGPENDLYHDAPSAGSIDNPMLRFTLQGDDEDSVKYLSYIDIITNDISTNWINNMLDAVKLYTNRGAKNPTGLINISTSFTNGKARLNLSSPYELHGTNKYNFYIGFDVALGSDPVDGIFGMKMTNRSIGFVDNINDDYAQTAFIVENYEGPTPATNVKIKSFGARYWDHIIIRVDMLNPSRTITNVEIPILSFDIRREYESLTTDETMRAIWISNHYQNMPFEGYINVYTNTFFAYSYEDAYPLSLSNRITHNDSRIKIDFGEDLVLSFRDNKPDRFFITYMPTMFSNAATNAFSVIGIESFGPDEGYVENSNFFLEQTLAPIALDDSSIRIELESKLPSTLKQRDSGIVGFAVDVSTFDKDAEYTMEGITIESAGDIIGSNDIVNTGIYIDDGFNEGEFDGDDTMLEGSGGTFIGGVLRSTFVNPITINKEAKRLYFVFDVSSEATPGTELKFKVDPTNQQDFTPIEIDGNYYSPKVSSLSGGTTGSAYLELYPYFDQNIPVIAVPSVANTTDGESIKLFLEDGESPSLYTVHVYDLLGYKITELNFNGNKADWDGTDDRGRKVSTGVYVMVVQGPDGFRETFKVVIQK